MRKANKILMATVAILLCLVLITTSVASGIFAKFVITKSGEATITFEKFGVTVTMSVPSTPTNKSFTSVRDIPGVEVSTETFSSTGHTITISGLKMHPGLEFPKAVRFDFSGTLKVPANLKITTTVEYDANVHKQTTSTDGKTTYYNYYVPADTIKNAEGTAYIPKTYFMPIGFTFSDNFDTVSDDKSVALSSWSASTDNTQIVSASAISNSIASGVSNRIKDSTATAPTDGKEKVVDKNVITFQTFAKNSAIKFKINDQTSLTSTYFHTGFYYPLDHGATAKEKEYYNRLATYIAEHTDPNCTITVRYTVELIQT